MVQYASRYNLRYPNFLERTGNNRIEEQPTPIPIVLRIMPIVIASKPRPPYATEVANMRGIRTQKLCSVNARKA